MFWYSLKDYVGWFVLVLSVIVLVYWGIQDSSVRGISIAVGKDSEVNLHAAEALKRHIEATTDVTVTLVPANGSQDARKLVVQGNADFAILLPQLMPDLGDLRVLAPIADHYLHLLLKPTLAVTQGSDLQDRTLALGSMDSDAYQLAVELLARQGLAISDIKVSNKDAIAMLVDDTLDGAVALLPAGDTIARQVLDKQVGRLAHWPAQSALVFQNGLLESRVIPGALYAAEHADYQAIYVASMLVAHHSTARKALDVAREALQSPQTAVVLAPFLSDADHFGAIKSWNLVPRAGGEDPREAHLARQWIIGLSALLALLAGVFLWVRNRQIQRVMQIESQHRQIVQWLHHLRNLEGEALADRDPNHLQHFLEQLSLLKGKVEGGLLEFDESNRSLLMTVLSESNALMNRLHLARLSHDR